MRSECLLRGQTPTPGVQSPVCCRSPAAGSRLPLLLLPLAGFTDQEFNNKPVLWRVLSDALAITQGVREWLYAPLIAHLSFGVGSFH